MAYYFNLPTYDDLNAKQKAIVTETDASVSILGGPGTGKSVVSIWRHITNYNSDLRKSILLTYTKSLCFFLAESINSRMQYEQDKEKKEKIRKAGENVALANSWNGNNYDEIIIDEAQDLPENELAILRYPGNNRKRDIVKQVNMFNPPINNYKTGDIYRFNGTDYLVNRWSKGYIKYIQKFASMVSYGADNRQILYPERATTEERFAEIFPKNKHYKLFQNYRNTYEILMFSKYVLGYDINQTTLDRLKDGKDARRGTKPVLKLINSINEQNDAIIDIVNDLNDGVTNIAILLFFNNQFNSIGESLTNKKIKFSKYNSDADDITYIDNIHLTTFKSAKGLEFDVVIIPEFESYQRLINSRYNVTEKDYFVAFTRARRNLFLISTKNHPNISESVLKREEFKVTNPPPNIINNINSEDLPF